MSKIVSLLFALCLVAPAVHAASDDICAHSLPVNIDAQDDLRQQMEVMLQQSVTFRQQCQRLAVPDLRVQIRTDAQLLDRPYRAQSTIRRLETGGFVAWVSITPFGNPTQWLAHELEHIIEQLEGVNVRVLATVTTRTAWRTGENMFETERAMRMGRLVLHEVRDAHHTLARATKGVEVTGRGD